MCGIPASGKSSWVKNHIYKLDGATLSVSRDNIRFSLVKENEEYFSREKDVYNIFVNDIKEYLKTKAVRNVIADATHLSPGSRAKLINSLGNSLKDVQIYAVVMDTPLEIALERNAKREGRSQVPESALRNMANSFKIPKLDEGFDKIYIYKDGEKIREIIKEVN